MNRLTASLFGAIIIAGLFYHPAAPSLGGSADTASGSAKTAAPRDGRSANGASSTASQEPVAGPCKEGDGPWKAVDGAIEFHHGTGAVGTHVGNSTATRAANSAFSQQLLADHDVKKVKTLIVTVPDPAHTRRAYRFDEAIDSIVEAATRSGYELDHFWLPWHDKPLPMESDCAKRVQAERERDRREQEPGLLVFRGKDGPEELSKESLLPPLWVFLVGESSIQGINKTQFWKAVNHIEVAGANSFCDPKCDIGVAGPASSGSVESFRDMLRYYTRTQAPVRFRVASPGVTAFNPLNTLREECGPKDSAEGVEGPCVSFRHMLRDDDTAIGMFRQYLQKNHDGLQMAFLSESATTYGQESMTGMGIVKDGKKGSKNDAMDATSRFEFPHGISRMREAYSENGVGIAVDNDIVKSVPRQLLPLVLTDEPLMDEDVPPDFGKRHTPIVEELVMRSLTEELAHDRIEMAGILASDSLDTLFLIHLFQQTNPDVQLLVFNWDPLFLRADDQKAPRGLLTITSYPGLVGEQDWSGTASSGHQFFGSAYSEALYNATAWLLERPDLMLDTAAPKGLGKGAKPEFDPKRLDPNVRFDPPVWLTVVGHDRNWPVTILTEGPAANDGPSPKPQLSIGEDPPRNWIVVWHVVNVVSVLYVLLFWLAQFFNHGTLENFRLSDGDEERTWGALYRLLQDRAAASIARRECALLRAFYLMISMLALWLIRLILVVPVVSVYSWAGSLAQLLSLIVAAWLGLTILLLFAVVVRLAALQPRNQIACYCGFGALAAGGASAGFGIWWYRTTRPDNYFHLFFSYRSAQLDSGVSPALPLVLLCLAVALWAWSELGRLAVGLRRAYLPAARTDSSFQIVDDALQATLNRPLYNWPLQLLLLILFAWGFYVASPRLKVLAVVEPLQFRACYMLLLALVTWLVFDHCTRFFLVWRQLRGILHRLEQLPFREAFSRLPKQSSSSTIWQPWGRGTQWRYKRLTQSLDALEALKAEIGISSLPTFEQVKKLREQIAKIIQSEVRQKCPSHETFAALQRALCSTAEMIAEGCSGTVWKHGASELLASDQNTSLTYEGRTNGFGQHKARIFAEEFLALRFAAYFRNTLVQFRYMLFYASAGFILSLLSIESYPFTAHRAMGWLLILGFMLLSVGVVMVFAQMDRDSILSRLSKTEPGKLDKDFFFRVASYGALPLLTVVASQFPSAGSFLFSWVEPALKLVK